jgi:methylphosphotriester-DNA--protein-cysteine methyltransferase
LAALALIHKSKGNIRISELTEQLHIGQSPLEKRFRQAVGASPKKFASIVRLKNVIQQYDSVNSLTELGYEAGFYDQAHFIKEFKTFTGCTPEKYFSSKK